MEPSKANDAYGTNSSYWQGLSYPQWWKVDLGDVYDITGIVLRNYVDGARYYQYRIEASLDDQTYTQIAVKTDANIATDAGDIYNVTTMARYLRVTMTYNSRNTGVHICDFRAYGTISAVHAGDYLITANADAEGTISPSGNVEVANGTDQAFIITPGAGYKVSDVLVDGVSVGAVSGYPFINVTANHTIYTTFTPLLNIALNKPATCESNIYPGMEPSKANDAYGTNSSYWQGLPYPQWWKVDLGDVYDITGIVLRNYVDGARYYQYRIEASLDDQTYTQIAIKTDANIATDAGDIYNVTTMARYLRVTMTYNSRNTGVHICDFRAYGTISAVHAGDYLITANADAEGTISPSGNVEVANGTRPGLYYNPGCRI